MFCYVTDHRFIRQDGVIFDRYGFRQDFFLDFAKVFGEISLIGREELWPEAVTEEMRVGEAVTQFLSLGTLTGPQWLLSSTRNTRGALSRLPHREALTLWLRAPSRSATTASRWATEHNIPYGVEVVGDPAESVLEAVPNRRVAAALAQQMSRNAREVVRRAHAATWVSRHLSEAYPIPSGRPSAVASSIRLSSAWFAKPRRLRASGEPKNVITVGTMLPVKRQADLVHALARSAFVRQLTIVGDGPLRGELIALGNRLGVGERLRLVGHISDRDALRDLLCASDVFVLASATEGLPRAVVEAMALGLPVVAADNPGTRELICPRHLYPSGDIGSLLDRIGALSAEDTYASASAYNVYRAADYRVDILSQRRIQVLRALKEASLA